MQQAHIILVGSGGQPYRDYAFRSLAGRYRLSALLPADPTWQQPHLQDWRTADLTDPDAVTGALKELADDGSAVLTWDETVLEVTAEAAGRLGLHHMSARSAQRCRDKYLTRRLLDEAGLPAVLQISQNAVAYHGHRLGPIAAATGAVARCSTAPLALHLDHADSWELVEAAPAEGFGSVMYDASRLNAEENLRRTAEAVRFGHAHGLWVEAELGRIGGKPGEPPLDAHAPGVRTDPAEAAARLPEEIGDVAGGAPYRRHLAGVLLGRLLGRHAAETGREKEKR